MERVALLLRTEIQSGEQTAVAEIVTKKLIGLNLKDGHVSYQKDHLILIISKTLFVTLKVKRILNLSNSESHHRNLWEHPFSQ